MTPVEPNAAAAEAPARADLLRDGEVVILAVRPSGWFVLVVSWPVLAVAAAAAATIPLTAPLFGRALTQQTVALVCLAVGVARVFFACFQWAAHLYMLTSLRVMRVRGLIRPEVLECPLAKVGEVALSRSMLERVLRVGSLLFVPVESGRPRVFWNVLARPEAVRQTVCEAIGRVH